MTVLKRVGAGENKLGQPIYTFEPRETFQGYLDLITGSDLDTKRNDFLGDSTHIIITFDVGTDVDNFDRIEVEGISYEITKVDNPMNLGHHLEIYCQKVSGQ